MYKRFQENLIKITSRLHIELEVVQAVPTFILTIEMLFFCDVKGWEGVWISELVFNQYQYEQVYEYGYLLSVLVSV